MSEANQTIQSLLTKVFHAFYSDTPRETFYRDKRLLTKALTWPALWMKDHGHKIPMPFYEETVTERIKHVSVHGEWKAPMQQGYFPRYFAKTLQDYFQFHADRLHDQYKAAGYHVDKALKQALKLGESTQDYNMDILAEAHKIASRKRPANPRKNPSKPSATPLQTELF